MYGGEKQCMLKKVKSQNKLEGCKEGAYGQCNAARWNLEEQNERGWWCHQVAMAVRL